MSQSFIDRSQQNNTSITPDETTQKKIDPVAQLKWINNSSGDQGFGIYGDNQPAQMFTSDEEDQTQRKPEEDLLQGKAKDKYLPAGASAKEGLQMKENPMGGSSGTKTSMPDDVRGKMENSFGADFKGIYIHQNSDKASNIGALAYTQGSDVHFAPGQYNPGSQKGQELLGHELTHVVQQRQGRVKATKQGKGMPINDNPALEKEADVMGAKAVQRNWLNNSIGDQGFSIYGDRSADNSLSQPAQMFTSEEEEKQVQMKESSNGKEQEKWRVTRHVDPEHYKGYQHIFDENGRLIIMYPVDGPDVFYITTTPDTYSDKGDGAAVGVGGLKKVTIQEVVGGLYAYYKQKPKDELKFVDRLYRYDKKSNYTRKEGYDYVQHRSVKNLHQAHKDFFTGGGWMMIVICLAPLIIEAIPIVIQSAPYLIPKIPKPLLTKALKSTVGRHLLECTGESVVDSLISYLFTGDVDLTSIGLNYVPGMGKTDKVQLLFKGLKELVDASVDFKLGEREIKTIVEGKSAPDALTDLIFGTLGGMTNSNIDKEFTQEIYRLILRGQVGSLFTGVSETIKAQFKDEKDEKDEKNTKK